MERNKRIVAPAPKLVAKFKELEVSVSAAAQPFTGRERLPLTPFFFHDLLGAEADMSRALKGSPDGTELHCARAGDGSIHYELWEPARG